MRYTRWIAFVLLIHGAMFAWLSVASAEVESNKAGFERTSFRLIAALGMQTLPVDQSEASSIGGHQNTLNPESSKSPTKAFLYSALVPGSGQLYIGAKRGYLQIAAEVGFLAAYFITRSNAEDLRKDYRAQVRRHVIFEGPTKFDDWDPIEDFEHATLFDNWHNVYTDNNGEPLERVGKWYWADRKAFKDEERKTHNSPQREVALELRKDANDKFQSARTFVGIVILNHVVSAIDARIATKNYNKKHAPQAAFPKPFELELQTTVSPHTLQSRVVLRKRF